jgi:uncharacterized membrane protein
VRRAASALAALLLAAAAWPAAAAEQIRSFDVDVHLERDGAFTVVEEIAYEFGAEKRHGIYRDIPVRYDQDWKNEYDVGLRVLSVTDEARAARPYQVSHLGSSVRIKIGDAHGFARPSETYRITYRVKRATVFRKDYDEVYWNVTGNGWAVPIGRASARVHYPASVPPSEVRVRCFTGHLGSREERCTAQAGSSSSSFATGALAPGEGLSVAVALPKGVLQEPGELEKAFDAFREWGGFWLFSPLVALLGMYGLWRSHGRDVGGRSAVPVRYEPPEGLTPAEAGTLLDESADMEDVTATILDLAVRGFLEIEEVETRKLLFFSDRDYWLRKKGQPTGLARHERKLVDAIFASADEVQVSALKNRFYKDVPDVVEALYEELSKRRHFFRGSPDQVRTLWRAAAFGVGVAALVAWGLFRLPPAAGLATLSCAGVVFAFARHMPRRTRKGRAAYEELLGFQEFMERVDRDRLERMGGRTAERFEACLPYAVVLGVADQWADAFADLYTQPPDWYRSARYRGGGFSPRIFVSDVGRSLGTMGQTFASRPSSSGGGSTGWSAGGAFSGGGGFSGGGFGGGGGGSW